MSILSKERLSKLKRLHFLKRRLKVTETRKQTMVPKRIFKCKFILLFGIFCFLKIKKNGPIVAQLHLLQNFLFPCSNNYNRNNQNRKKNLPKNYTIRQILPCIILETLKYHPRRAYNNL